MGLHRSIHVALLLGSLGFGSGSPLPGQEAARTIPIKASKFAFAPAEVRLKKGEAVVLALTTQDVAHGLKSNALGLDAKILPGKETKVTFTPQKTGSFEANCSTFCGSGHFGMKMTFIVE
jgi:cytochrome c oxidase subunit II